MILSEDIFARYTPEEKALIDRAAKLAQEVLQGEFRSNNHPFFEHPMAVARIVAQELGLTADCVAAVFLHEASSYCKRKGENADEACPLEVRKKIESFGKDILTMVEGLDKISTIRPKDTRLEAENYKKLIVSYSKDPRVILLKLADRLEIMRSLSIFPKSSREKKALETLMLYIPLAHQLGLFNMKSEMEDIYFSYAEPEQYKSITNHLKITEPDRQKLTSDFIEPLKTRLSEAGIRYKLKARTKTAFSIWKKMQKQKVDFDGVYDVFAIRFIIETGDCGREEEKALCWKVFSYVTEKYESDTARLRDWLSNPKPNGYESLHITVKNNEGAYLEVQIRSQRMDEVAESGLASHWSYKGIKQEVGLDQWLNALRNSIENGTKLSMPDSEGDDDLPAPPTREIFVFTPNGDLRKLPAGATVLDFAFDIHTKLGSQCTGGRINGKAVSFREPLKTGDYVEIFSSKNQKPTADWLNWTVTSKARNKIRQSISEKGHQKAAEGRELLERRLRNWKLVLKDEDLAEYMKKLQIKTIKDFYEAVGEGKIDPSEVKEYILDIENARIRAAQAAAQAAQERMLERAAQEEDKQKDADDIMVIDAKNVKKLDYCLAKCCNPEPGDDIFGFISIKSGLKIHRMSCPNAARLLEKYPYRIQKVKWKDKV
jgi:GTP pyrophosphokinase